MLLGLGVPPALFATPGVFWSLRGSADFLPGRGTGRMPTAGRQPACSIMTAGRSRAKYPYTETCVRLLESSPHGTSSMATGRFHSSGGTLRTDRSCFPALPVRPVSPGRALAALRRPWTFQALVPPPVLRTARALAAVRHVHRSQCPRTPLVIEGQVSLPSREVSIPWLAIRAGEQRFEAVSRSLSFLRPQTFPFPLVGV